MDLLDFCFRVLAPYVNFIFLIIIYLMFRKIRERMIGMEQLKSDHRLLWLEYIKSEIRKESNV